MKNEKMWIIWGVGGSGMNGLGEHQKERGWMMRMAVPWGALSGVKDI